MTQASAPTTAVLSTYTLRQLFVGTGVTQGEHDPDDGATLDRLRHDRFLEEALTCGRDPLHLAAVFGTA